MRSSVWTRAVALSLVISSLCIGVGHGVAKDDRASAKLSGIASVYDRSSGKQTASGEQLDEGALTAAHRSLPFGTLVKVKNNKNGREATVRINDRGPFVGGRVLDLTPAGARALGFSGTTDVSLTMAGSSEK
jgi:rare lipoprotein A